MDDVTVDFEAGVDAYWGGVLPDGWDKPKRREKSPYLMGWWMASMWETSPGWIRDRYNEPMQEGE